MVVQQEGGKSKWYVDIEAKPWYASLMFNFFAALFFLLLLVGFMVLVVQLLVWVFVAILIAYAIRWTLAWLMGDDLREV